MSALSFSPFPAIGAPGATIARLRAQFGPLALIVAVACAVVVWHL